MVTDSEEHVARPLLAVIVLIMFTFMFMPN